MAPLLYYSLLSLPFILFINIFLQMHTRRLKNLPPGPPTIPIIGNLHHLKQPLHRTLTTVSKKYGDIISLWFGSRLVIVVSSLPLVQECFTKNDVVLANRPRFLTSDYLYTTVGSAYYGAYWRNIRRIATIDVLSNHRLNTFLGIRRDEIHRLIRKLGHETATWRKVELKERLTEMTFNAMMRMISGKRYYGDDSDVTDIEEARQFREIIAEMLSLLGANNKGDFLPLLRWFDFENLEKRLKRIAKKADLFLQGLIQEHRDTKDDGSHDNMIYHLLHMQETQPELYTDYMIKGLIQGMLLAGTDTTAATIEWAMAELLNHPEVLKKAKEEIHKQIGEEELVDEQNVSKLQYLHNIISETLRLHPPAPLLLPHCSMDDCTIGGFNVPRDTIVLTNVWSIHRDPQLWSDATSFKPERFEKEGEVNKLISFGLGRRACPGQGLALRNSAFTLGLLIQCFDWKRVSEEKIDMMEDKGLSMPKLIPVEAMCKALPIVNDLIMK